MGKIKIYLDNCCFNRPFDEQNQILIELETIAKLEIQRLIKEGCYDLVWSFMLDKENSDNPHENRKIHILEWKKYAQSIVKDSSDVIAEKAKEISKKGIKPKDSAHLAIAIMANCDYFITTDKKLLNKNLNDIEIINPIYFIEREGIKDE
ncbi:MAG: hypothetical protein FWD23_07855 [Oscillospiraceae bacterium]|nr:hypothetical protein [Oscillospiraceae bacterium]